jgi:hypothetical protein
MGSLGARVQSSFGSRISIIALEYDLLRIAKSITSFWKKIVSATLSRLGDPQESLPQFERVTFEACQVS